MLILSFYLYRQEKVAREFIDNNSSFAEVEETQSQAKKKGQMFRQKFDLSLKQPNFSWWYNLQHRDYFAEYEVSFPSWYIEKGLNSWKSSTLSVSELNN